MPRLPVRPRHISMHQIELLMRCRVGLHAWDACIKHRTGYNALNWLLRQRLVGKQTMNWRGEILPQDEHVYTITQRGRRLVAEMRAIDLEQIP